jgi:hypothetical protein
MDLNRSAFRIVQSLTGEKRANPRSESARAAGRRGGPARAHVLPPERRKEIAKAANRVRWSKYRGDKQVTDAALGAPKVL